MNKKYDWRDFKVGDRVTVTENNVKIPKGTVCIVTEIIENGKRTCIRTNKDCFAYYWYRYKPYRGVFIWVLILKKLNIY